MISATMAAGWPPGRRRRYSFTVPCPGERVLARLTDRKRSYDEGETLEVLEPSPDRVKPRCPHFGQCGGCSLQHLDSSRQIESKQNTLLQNLERIGKVVPNEIWSPLTGPSWHYRRKARLSVRYVHKKERVLVGFRERYGTLRSGHAGMSCTGYTHCGTAIRVVAADFLHGCEAQYSTAGSCVRG